MIHSIRQSRSIPVTLLLIPLLVFLACMPLTGGSSPDSGPDETTIEQNLTFGPGTFTFMDPRAGLAELSSYTASLTVTFDGTRDRTPLNWSRTYTMHATNGPHARQWTVEQTGESSTAIPVFLAELDGTDYERRDETACSATEVQEGNSLTDQLELASFLTGVIGAEEAGSETVNEISAKHYTFDQRALGEEGVTESAGEMWVADEGGYIVRYRLTSTTAEEFAGEGNGGTVTLAYELTAPNQPVTIELPEDCPPGMIDSPVPPEASNIVRLPGLLSYDSTTSVSEAAAFHQKELAKLGWVPEGQPSIDDTGALFSFKRGDQVLTAIIYAEGEIIKVNVTVNRVGS